MFPAAERIVVWTILLAATISAGISLRSTAHRMRPIGCGDTRARIFLPPSQKEYCLGETTMEEIARERPIRDRLGFTWGFRDSSVAFTLSFTGFDDESRLNEANVSAETSGRAEAAQRSALLKELYSSDAEWNACSDSAAGMFPVVDCVRKVELGRNGRQIVTTVGYFAASLSATDSSRFRLLLRRVMLPYHIPVTHIRRDAIHPPVRAP